MDAKSSVKAVWGSLQASWSLVEVWGGGFIGLVLGVLGVWGLLTEGLWVSKVESGLKSRV